jgi:hypothetical protein
VLITITPVLPATLVTGGAAYPLTSLVLITTAPVRPATDWTGAAADAAAVRPLTSPAAITTAPVRPATLVTGVAAYPLISEVVSVMAPVRPATELTCPCELKTPPAVTDRPLPTIMTPRAVVVAGLDAAPPDPAGPAGPMPPETVTLTAWSLTVTLIGELGAVTETLIG